MCKIILLPVTIALLATLGCSGNKEGANYLQVSDNDPGMKAAIAKAKASTRDFVSAFHAQRPGTSGFSVKKPFPTPNGTEEHMWIDVLSEQNGELKGRIANEAEETREVKLGQSVTLKLSEMSDWKYQNGRKLVGGFTIRYLADRMPPKEREALLKEAGFELDP